MNNKVLLNLTLPLEETKYRHCIEGGGGVAVMMIQFNVQDIRVKKIIKSGSKFSNLIPYVCTIYDIYCIMCQGNVRDERETTSYNLIMITIVNLILVPIKETYFFVPS